MISQNDASILLGTLTALGIPFAVAWLPRVSAPSWLKWVIAAAISLIGGYLTLVVSGELQPGLSLIQAASLILSASQVFYYVAFKGLGLEAALYPKAALVTRGKDYAAKALEGVSHERAKDVLNPESDTTLEVSTVIKGSRII